MAGQRMYYSNILTTTRGEVRVPLKLAFQPGSSSTHQPWLTLLGGHGLSTTAAVTGTTALTVTSVVFTTTNGGNYNCFNISWPERFGKCICQNVDSVQAQANDTAYPVFTADFSVATTSATTTQSQVSINIQTASTNSFVYQLGVNTTTQTYILYLEGIFELGM